MTEATPIDSAPFRAAMSRLGAAVNIITTACGDERHGMTASAVCSVSDAPATLLVCINRTARLCEPIERHRTLCINVLSAEQQDVSQRFAGRGATMEERFATGVWRALENGAPALNGALCNLGCRVESAHAVGSHYVFFCRVEEVRLGDETDGLVYFDRAYHRLPMRMADAPA